MYTPIHCPNNSRIPAHLRHPLFTGLLAIGSLALSSCFAVGVVTAHIMDDNTVYCESAAEARAAGLYFDTVLVEPRTVRYGPYTVDFANCTLCQTRHSHRPYFGARRVEKQNPEAWVTLRWRASYEGLNPPEDGLPGGLPILRSNHRRYGGQHLMTGPSRNGHLDFRLPIATEGNRKVLCLDAPFLLTITGHEAGAPDTLRFRAYPAAMRAQLPR